MPMGVERRDGEEFYYLRKAKVIDGTRCNVHLTCVPMGSVRKLTLCNDKDAESSSALLTYLHAVCHLTHFMSLVSFTESGEEAPDASDK